MDSGPGKHHVLSVEQINRALELAIGGSSLRKIASELGFKTDFGFYQYRQANPSFDSQLKIARVAHCEHLEDDLLDVHNQGMDHGTARVRLEAATRVMAFRDPAKYNPKVDLNVSGNLDLSAVLVAANARLPELRDVSPALPAKHNDFDELL